MPSYAGGRPSGRTPLHAFVPQRRHQSYVSPYGPKTKNNPNIMGFTAGKAIRYGYLASGFGVAAGIFAVFFFGEVPRVRQDILQKIPVIGDYWIKEVAPEDNPF